VTGYTARVNTRWKVAALSAAGWGVMLSPLYALTTYPGLRYVLDNGAWSAHASGGALDVGIFLAAHERVGAGADFTVAPDIVAGGLSSLRLSERWLPRLVGAGPVLLAVQDGMAPCDVAGLLGSGSGVGLFVGGSTRWKWGTLRAWTALGAALDAHVHVGRVNSPTRIRAAAEAGADSFDGSGLARFTARDLPRLGGALAATARQTRLPW